MLTRRSMIGASVAALALAGRAPGAAAVQPVLIGGGPTDGAHAEAARRICDLLNEHAGETYGCFARSTPGSVFTLRAIESALMEFGFARSVRHGEAVAGRGVWEGRPATTLRGVFGLHPEAALLVTGADVAEALVYGLVRTVFENLDALEDAHPAFRDLDPPAMLEGIPAPLHPGAARYYRERGWLRN